MPRQPHSNYMSLNHIRDCLIQSKKDKKTGKALIDQFLPEWDDKARIDYWSRLVLNNKGQSVNNQDVNNFCSGNCKKDGLFNGWQLTLIVEKLKQSGTRSNETYIPDTLALVNKWIVGPPRVTQEHPVFFLEFISKKNPSESDILFFGNLKKTVEILRKINTEESLTYALFLIVMVGVLQERIIEVPEIYQWNYIRKRYPQFMPSISEDDNEIIVNNCMNSDGETNLEMHRSGCRSLPKRGIKFVEEVLNLYSEADIESIDFAFHGGDHWLMDDEKIDILEQIAKKRIHLRVLINSEDAVSNICVHMRRKRQSFRGFDKAFTDWKRWEEDYPDTIEVRVSSIPILHRVYLFRKKTGNGVVNVTCYTYGKYTSKKDVRLCYDENDPEYVAFANEFDYLWEKSGES